MTALNHDKNSKYGFLVNTELHAIFNSTFKDSLTIMKNETITKQAHILMLFRTIMSRPLEDIIKDLILSGILQHKTDQWNIHRQVVVEIEDPRIVLSMSDLEFGFVIFLGAMSLPIVVFYF
ncbi:hypothetical protein PVAND_008833 [Polypedilum vanderplanki]|uniref:Uncharacterized protein n=1 Tax=Polypedilum vanderplanki TaxID=319348 RepID=A0A9J6CBG7_POLVA|nr:hypothetical protein PVAND_008833 [Polypedilum vanderplanki]